MKKIHFIALLLVATILFVSCGNGDAPDSESSESTTETIEQNTDRVVELATNNTANYKIVLPENSTEQLEAAVDSLKSKLKDVTDIRFSVKDDYTQDGGVIDSTGEIIIGNCKRTEMQDVLKTLTYRDYAIVITDSNILIAGYETSKVIDAVYSFMKFLDEESVTKSGASVLLNWSGDYSKTYSNYKFDTLTIGGVDISEYRIVYPANSGVDDYLFAHALDLQDSIGRRCGVVVPICSDAREEQRYELLLGNTNRQESQAYYSGDHAPDDMEYGITINNGKVILASGGWYSLSGAIDAFDTKLSASKDGALDDIHLENVSMLSSDIPATQGDYRFMSYNVMADLSGYYNEGNVGRVKEAEIRKEIVSALVLNYQPAVVAFQEVFENWYAQLVPAIEEDYTFVPLRTDGANRTMLAYNKHKVKLIDHGYHLVVEKDSRVVVWAIFEDLNTQTRFAVFGGHFSVTVDDAGRAAEARIMVDVIKQVMQTYDVPLIAMGDFNSGREGEVAKVFLQENDFEQAMLNGYDHIYCNNGFTTVASGCEKNNHAQQGSDHYPIWADINLTND